MPEPSVSILVPCYNAAPFLRKTVESVLAQTRADWEMVIVDDGSTDGSTEVAQQVAAEDERITAISQANGGVSRARLAGLAAARPDTPFLYFLDADDILEPTMLEVVIGHLERHPAVGMAYSGWSHIDDAGAPLTLEQPRLNPRPVPWGLWVRHLRDDELHTPFVSIFCAAGLTPSLAIMRRSTYERTEGWDPSMGQPAEDTHLFLQFALAAEVHHLGQPLVRYRIHATQSSTSGERTGAQWRLMLGRWVDLSQLEPGHAETVRKAWRFRERAFTLRKGLLYATRHLRAGKYASALRFAGGAARIALRSVVLGEPPRRRAAG